MVGRWSEAATLKFVYYYKLHECLWNTRSEFYNVKDARNAAYSDLVVQMGMPDFDIRAAKVKIKNLRAHYFTELKKVRHSHVMGGRYEPTLYWYKEMDSFLKDIIGDIPSLQQPEVITADSIYDSSCIYENVGDFDEDSMGKASPIFHMGETARGVVAPPRAPRQPNIAVTNKKRKRPNANEPQDEFEAFGKSVAAQLRKLSVSRALRAQTRIQTIITEERIHDLETTSPPPEPVLPAVRELHDAHGIGGGGGSIDSGADSGIDGIDTSSGGGSVLGLPSPPSITSDVNPIFEPAKISTKEFKNPVPGKTATTNDVIVKAECELITLDEDDPFEGH